MMAMNRDNPFVNVYVGGENTLVHIRQLVHTNENATLCESRDGVMMTLLQFRSLMFHLRALDAQFTHGVMEKDVVVNEEVGKKSTGNETVLDSGQTRDNNEEGVSSSFAGQKRAWHEVSDEMDGILATLQPDPEMPVVYVPTPVCTTGTASYKTTTPKTTTPNVRDELAIIYADEVIAVLPQHVVNNCTGCAFGYDKNTRASEHEVCTLPRKKRVDLFTIQILNIVDECTVRDKFTARMKSLYALFDVQKMYVKKSTLLASEKWMKKVKKLATDM